MPSASNKSPGSITTKIKSKCAKRSVNVKSEEPASVSASELTLGDAAAAAVAVNSLRRSELSRRDQRKNCNESSKGVKQKSVFVQTVVVSSNASKLNADPCTFDDGQLKKNEALLSLARKTTFVKRKNKTRQAMKDSTSEKLIEKVEIYNRVLNAMKKDFA